MRCIFSAAMFGFLAIQACTKPSASKLEDNGCIQRYSVPLTQHSIPDTAIQIAAHLFTNNGIDIQNLRFYQYAHDTFQGLVAPYTKFDEHLVRADQYVKGLHVFTGAMVFVFWDGQLHFKSDNATKGTALDTVASLSLARMRSSFLNNLELFDHASARYRDSCFNAELGFYNLNMGLNAPEILVKAWHVTPKFSSYPEAFYRDTDGGLIYFFDGLYSFR